MKTQTKQQNQFVWLSLRISFWIMIFLWGLATVLPEHEGLYFQDWLFIIAIIFNFVVSIIHLVKFKEKALAITSLVISSIGVFLFFIGFLIGIAEYIALS